MVKLYVASTRFGKTFRVSKIIEYCFGIDMENDSDGFEFIIGNPGGEINGIFSTFDIILIKLNDTDVMKGIVDTVRYDTGISGSIIKITGRDNRAILVDNDAMPDTLENINSIAYITRKCGEYNIAYHPYLSISKRTDLIIGTGESEISIMNNLLITDRQRLWYFNDTLYSGMWDTGAKTSVSFARSSDGTKKDCINIESLSLTEDSKNTKSQIVIYGSVDDGKEHVVGSAKNDALINRGITRRMTKRSSDNDSTSRYSASALREVRDSLRDNISIQVCCYTGNNVIIPNHTAHVYDNITGIDGDFFIYSVEYNQSISEGSTMSINMIPHDKTFDIIWKSQPEGNSVTKKKYKDRR